MMSLWSDGWFYVSAGGFVLSCVLFVFLLGQYRAAVEAEDAEEAEPESPSTQERVYVPKPVVVDASDDEPPPLKTVDKPAAPPPVSKSPAPAPKPAPAPAAKAAPQPAPAPQPKPVVSPATVAAAAKKAENTTGGLSPAVVYLQNLKIQMERLDKDIAGLKSLAGQQAAQNETILKRLSELAEKLASRPAAAEAPAPAAAIEPVLEPEPAAAAPAPAVVAQQEAAPIRTIELEMPVAAPAPEPAPAPMPAPAPQPVAAADRTIVIEPERVEPKAVPAPAPASEPTLVIEPTVAPLKLGDTKSIPLPKPPGMEIDVKEPEKPKDGDKPQEPPPKPTRKGPVWPI